MRFVILRHKVSSSFDRTDSDHWDWMWQVCDEDRLWTWSTDITEIRRPLAIPATRLPDHRMEYLDYEGPISGNRGRVDRVAAGEYEVVTADGQEIAARITRVIQGDFRVGDLIVFQRKRFGPDERLDCELLIAGG